MKSEFLGAHEAAKVFYGEPGHLLMIHWDFFLNDATYFQQMSISLLKRLKFRVILYSFNVFSPKSFFLQKVSMWQNSFIHSLKNCQGPRSQNQCHLGYNVIKSNKQRDISFLAGKTLFKRPELLTPSFFLVEV